MYLCDEGHGEICYEGTNCPACVIIGEKEDEIEDLKSVLDELRTEIENLEEK